MLLPVLIDPHVHWSAGSLSPPSSPDSSFYKPSDFIHLPTSDSFSFSQLFNHGRRTTCPRLYRPLRCLSRSGPRRQARVSYFFFFRQVYISQLLIWILRARFNDLATQYEAAFGTKPKYIARAPGRVKYVSVCLYPAFPSITYFL